MSPIGVARLGRAGPGGCAAGGLPHKPSPWADTWPVARLRVPSLHVQQYVLAGTSGQALAFGPGMHGAFSGSAGNWTILAGHRDTHFASLQGLEAGMLLSLALADGALREYRVQPLRVADSRYERRPPPFTASSHLLLVTCHPFTNADVSGPLRYGVLARPA